MADERKPAGQPGDRAEIERAKLRRIGDGLRDMCKDLTTADLPDDIRRALDQLNTKH